MIKVICSQCGGRGYRMVLNSEAYAQGKMDFDRVDCLNPECDNGYVMVMSFEEKQEEEKGAVC